MDPKYLTHIKRSRISPELTEAIQWLSELGIDVKKGRFSNYANDVLALESGLSKEQTADMYDSGLEVNDLIMIHKGLSHLKDDEFCFKLRKYIEGPKHAQDERKDGASHIARNTGFELLIASLFSLAGFKVDFEGAFDVRVTDRDNVFYIECKRPRSHSSLKKNMQIMYSQLEHRYREHDQLNPPRGLAVVSITKIVNPTNGTLPVERPDDAFQKCEKIFSDFLDQHKTIWYRNLHEDTMAVLLYLQLTVLAKGYTGTFFHRQFWGIYVRPGHYGDIKDLDLDRMYFHYIVQRLNAGSRLAFQEKTENS